MSRRSCAISSIDIYSRIADRGGQVAPPAANPSQATGRVKRHDNQLHRARVLEVRIHLPPAESPLRTHAGFHLGSTAQRIHHTTEFTSSQSPGVFRSRPLCAVIVGSISPARIAFSAWRVPPSSAPISRE